MRQPPFSIQARYARETADGLRRLADQAERGLIIGAGYIIIDAKRNMEEGAIGYVREYPQQCAYGAQRLLTKLCWPKEEL